MNSTLFPTIVHVVGTVRSVHITTAAPGIGYIYAVEGRTMSTDPFAGIRWRIVKFILIITLYPTVVMPFDRLIATFADGSIAGLAVYVKPVSV